MVVTEWTDKRTLVYPFDKALKLHGGGAITVGTHIVIITCKTRGTTCLCMQLTTTVHSPHLWVID